MGLMTQLTAHLQDYSQKAASAYLVLKLQSNGTGILTDSSGAFAVTKQVFSPDANGDIVAEIVPNSQIRSGGVESTTWYNVEIWQKSIIGGDQLLWSNKYVVPDTGLDLRSTLPLVTKPPRTVVDYAVRGSNSFYGTQDFSKSVVIGLSKTNVGLGSVDNTADLDKPVSTAMVAALGTRELVANKGIANGYASLGPDGKIVSSQIPAIAIIDTFTAESEADMLAVDAEQGDVCIRADLNKSFILAHSDPTVLDNWRELLSPPNTVLSVNGQVGAVVLDLVTKAVNTGVDFERYTLASNPNKSWHGWWDADGHIHFETVAGSGADIFFHPDGGTVHLNTSLDVSGNGEIHASGRINSNYDPIDGTPALWLSSNLTPSTHKDYVFINPPTGLVFDHFLHLLKPDGTDAMTVDSTGNTVIAGALQLRNGTNPQTLNVYNTYTDNSNYERGFIKWSGTSFNIGTEKAGTGLDRVIQFWIGGSARLGIATASLYPNSSNAFDLGMSGNKFRTGYFGTSVDSPLFLAGNGANVAPSISFSAYPGIGMYAADQYSVGLAGNLKANGSILLLNNGYLGFGNGGNVFSDGVGTLSLKYLSQAHGLNIYNFTDNNTAASQVNYERGFLKWSGNNLQFGTEKGGTGQTRPIQLSVAGTNVVYIVGTGIAPNTTNAVDLGTSSNAFRSIYTGTSVNSPVFLAGDGTAAAPGLAFSADPNSGMYRPGAGLLSFAAGGYALFGVGRGYMQLYGTTPQLQFGSTADLFLSRDTANTLSLRNGASPQAILLYNTYTDNSNYERGFLKWSGNLLQLGTEKGGTGTGRGIQFLIDGMVRYTLYGNQLTPEGNNTQDLGTATKAWKNIYAGTKVEAPVLNATTEVQVAGVPQAKVVARVALTGQTAAIPETALFTPDGVHQYRVTTSLMITQTTATAGTVGGVYIKYNNGLTDRSDNTNTAMNANAVASASSVLSVAAGSSKPVGYSVSYSATGGSCIYCLYLVVEQLQ